MDKEHGASAPEPAREADGEADMVAAAEAAVARLKAQYKGWLLGDIAKMKAAHAAAGDAARRAAHLQALYAVSHDVKGQGGSFGFHLVTEIGQSLCSLIKSGRGASDTGLAAVAAHIAALEAIAEAELEGDGGEAGARLLARLGAEVAALPG